PRHAADAPVCQHGAARQGHRQKFQKNKPIETMKTKSITSILAAVLLGSMFALADSGVPKSYPLTTCVVSDEKLGEHGKPVKVTSEETDVWLCCKSCIKDFNQEPKKFVTMVKDAQAKKR